MKKKKPTTSITNAAKGKQGTATKQELAQMEAELKKLRTENVGLKAKFAKFDALYKNVPVGCFTLTKKGEVLDYNPYLGKLLKLKSAQGQCLSLFDFTTKTSSVEVKRFTKTVFTSTAAASPMEFEIEVNRTKLQVRLEVVYKIDDGRASCVMIDISTANAEERKQKDFDVERLKFALEGSNEGVWDWNVMTNEVYFSPRWKSMIGFKEQEIAGNFDEWSTRVHPEDLAKAYEEINKAFTTKNYSYAIEHRMKCKNGKYKWIEAKGKVLEWNADNKPVRMVGTHTDISKLKAHEEALLTSEEKYRSVVENSPIVIYNADLSERITYMNNSGGARALKDIIGKSLYDFVKPEYHNIVRRSHRNVFENKAIDSYETETVDINGDKLWFQTQICPMIMNNKVVGLTLFSLNITSRKHAEEKIIQSLKEKEILLKEVHHRVKNNLQIISSILNLQTSKTSDSKTLEIIHDSQLRIKSMSIIHELLYRTNDFSKINFSVYIREILSNLLSSSSKSKNIEMVYDVETIYLDLDLSIPCGLIINELVTNSFKYAFNDTKKGKLTINLNKEEGKVKLRIADNGKGMPAKINYRDTQSLGMQLVMTLTQQIDGKIELDNKNGAAYTITFNDVSSRAKREN